MQLKNDRHDEVVLLLGNHDLQNFKNIPSLRNFICMKDL